MVTNLETAIEDFRKLAGKSFEKGAKEASKEPPDDPGERNFAEWEAEVAKGKAQMASALQQLAQADIMLSELRGRISYRALADLITNTNAALSELVRKTDGTTVEQEARAQLISAHAALLQALANIAPLATWTNTRSSGAS